MRSYWVFMLALITMLPTEIRAQHIDVLTYNIRYDNPADGPDAWPFRKQELARYVFGGKYSIIGLQEVLQHQLHFLDSMQSEYAYFGVGREDGQTKGEYAPVFWKTAEFSLENAETKWLSQTPDEPSMGWDAACIRIATVVNLRQNSNGKRWCIINTHWDHEGIEARFKSAQLIAKWVADMKPGCDLVVVMGDFNSTPSDNAFSAFEGILHSTASESDLQRSTFNAFQTSAKDNLHIDDIYTSILGKNLNYKVDEPKTISGRQLSDHFPVQVTLQAQ